MWIEPGQGHYYWTTSRFHLRLLGGVLWNISECWMFWPTIEGELSQHHGKYRQGGEEWEDERYGEKPASQWRLPSMLADLVRLWTGFQRFYCCSCLAPRHLPFVSIPFLPSILQGRIFVFLTAPTSMLLWAKLSQAIDNPRANVSWLVSIVKGKQRKLYKNWCCGKETDTINDSQCAG